MTEPVLVLVMGVSASGKSTIGSALAKKYGWIFLEGDDFHSEAAKARMKSGQPLDDSMRAPWIQRMVDRVQLLYQEGRSAVLAYSGLRRAHRDQFRASLYKKQVCCLLSVDKQILADRMVQRKEHFMPSSLLDSQFAALEWPSGEPDVHIISAGEEDSTVQAIGHLIDSTRWIHSI
ncbi:MAG: gluconokinase [Myxococcales bacterium]|nr:gluconokinase [Myxococcales bacterium]